MKAKHATRRDRWLSILSSFGGRAVTSLEMAKKAIEDEAFPELLEAATLRVLQNDFRKCVKGFDDDGSPGAVMGREYRLNEDGQTVSVEVWRQSDLCEIEHFEFTVHEHCKGIQKDVGNLSKLVRWGIKKWGNEAEKIAVDVQSEYGLNFDLGE